MHRRVAVIAERDVAEFCLEYCLARHGSPHRKPYDGPEADADGERGGKPRDSRHAQDRPRRALRRMRGGRAMTVTVVVGVAMMMMAVGVGGKHLTMLYYNITSATDFQEC